MGSNFNNVVGAYQISFDSEVWVQKYVQRNSGAVIFVPRVGRIFDRPSQPRKGDHDERFRPVAPKSWFGGRVGSTGAKLDETLKITKGNTLNASLGLKAPTGEAMSLAYKAEYQIGFDLSLSSKRAAPYVMEKGDGNDLILRMGRVS